MTEKRFVCIDIDYGDEWHITDNGKRLSEMEIVELLNSQEKQILDLKAENERLKLQLQTKIILNKQYEEKEKLKKCINQLEKENKILHQRIQILREEIQSTRQILKMQIDKLEGY